MTTSFFKSFFLKHVVAYERATVGCQKIVQSEQKVLFDYGSYMGVIMSEVLY